jgi:hypothetical protein
MKFSMKHQIVCTFNTNSSGAEPERPVHTYQATMIPLS